MKLSGRLLALGMVLLWTSFILAGDVVLKDPTGDDNGPGAYTYPTDGAYKAGSFDITQLKVKQSGEKLTFELSVNSELEDVWRMGGGFSVQMAFIFIQTDPQAEGFTKTYPGLNVQFAPDSKWQKCIILSPQQPGRLKSEVEGKAKDLLTATIIPVRTKGAGRTISATVDLKEIGGGDPATWGFQVLMQSNEGFPAASDMLTRKVNEFEGQHRFGGGNDGDCDPHVMDLFAGEAKGEKTEIDLQHKMLAFECNPDGSSKTPATLTMIHPAPKK